VKKEETDDGNQQSQLSLQQEERKNNSKQHKEKAGERDDSLDNTLGQLQGITPCRACVYTSDI
jgi:hypothetical protein